MPPAKTPRSRTAAPGPSPLSTTTVLRIFFTLAAASLFLYSLYLVRSIIVLVLISGFLAVGLDPAVKKLEARGLRRGHAVGAIFAALAIFLTGFVAAVIPPLVTQATRFATNLPEYVQDLAANNPRIHEFVEENDIAARLEDATKDLPNQVAGSVGSVIGIAGSVLSNIFRVLTIIVLTIYFSLSLSAIRERGLQLIPRSRRERVSRLLDPILEKIGSYIAGNVIVSIIAGIVSFIFLISAGVPFPVALALWVAIADLLPLVGATLGAVPAVIVAFFDSTFTGVITLIFFAIYQQAENYYVAPRVMTKAVDLSPAAVLLAAMTGATLLGFVGALMAIPAAAAVKVIVEEVIQPRAESA